jgi:hypothetical protein
VQKASTEVVLMFYTRTEEKRTRILFIRTELEMERDRRGSYNGIAHYSSLLGCYAVSNGK